MSSFDQCGGDVEEQRAGASETSLHTTSSGAYGCSPSAAGRGATARSSALALRSQRISGRVAGQRDVVDQPDQLARPPARASSSPHSTACVGRSRGGRCGARAGRRRGTRYRASGRKGRCRRRRRSESGCSGAHAAELVRRRLDAPWPSGARMRACTRISTSRRRCSDHQPREVAGVFAVAVATTAPPSSISRPCAAGAMSMPERSAHVELRRPVTRRARSNGESATGEAGRSVVRTRGPRRGAKNERAPPGRTDGARFRINLVLCLSAANAGGEDQASPSRRARQAPDVRHGSDQSARREERPAGERDAAHVAVTSFRVRR